MQILSAATPSLRRGEKKPGVIGQRGIYALVASSHEGSTFVKGNKPSENGFLAKRNKSPYILRMARTRFAALRYSTSKNHAVFNEERAPSWTTLPPREEGREYYFSKAHKNRFKGSKDQRVGEEAEGAALTRRSLGRL